MCSSRSFALPIESPVGIGYPASFACSAIVLRSSNAVWYEFDGESARSDCFNATITTLGPGVLGHHVGGP